MDIFTETVQTGTGNGAVPLGLLAMRLAVDTVMILIMIFGIYRPRQKRTASAGDLTFTFVLFNILIFFTASLLAVSSMKTGIAFALFAVFSILRYRTVQMEIVDMTFLFIAIISAVINSTVTRSVETEIILAIDFFIIGITALLSYILCRSRGVSIPIRFEHIELMNKSKEPELLKELSRRTGYEIIGFEIVQINYTQDMADLIVHCGKELTGEDLTV